MRNNIWLTLLLFIISWSIVYGYEAHEQIELTPVDERETARYNKIGMVLFKEVFK